MNATRRTWKAGGVYRHHAFEGMLIHVIGPIPTSIYGEITVAETTSGMLMPLPDEQIDQWVEAKTEEWEQRIARIKRPTPRLREVTRDDAD